MILVYRRRVFAAGAVLALVALLSGPTYAQEAPGFEYRNACTFRAEQDVLSVTLPMPSYRIDVTERGHEVFADGFGRLLVPGKPNLPSRIFSLAVPPGVEVTGLTFETAQGVELAGSYQIPPAPLPRVIGEADPQTTARRQAVFDQNREDVYRRDDVYPQQAAQLVGTGGYRKYNLVDVQVSPFGYHPASGRLVYYPEITVHVHFIPAAGSRTLMEDSLARTEKRARDIILNYDHVGDWYPQGTPRGRGLHDFVIITLDSLTSAVTPLVNWETNKGRTVYVVTTTWIDSNYTGYDLAEKMRNFLRDKYPSGEWGIEDVLLVGHYDDVPMRRTAQDLGYGAPETDYYYAELSLPDDQSWDSDGDHNYGEDTDPIDFYTEIIVGRIPWSDASTVQSICNKSVAYEQNEDPGFKKNMLLLGAFFWNDDPNPRTDNAELMEAKIDQPWMADWTFTRMYEKNSECYSTYDCDYELLHSNVMAVWPTGQFAFVNWAGHGSPTSSHIYGLGAPAFISSSDCPSLDDNYPAIVFANACSNSDTDYLNLGQAMIQQGAIGFIGATKVALGCPGWNDPLDGSSQSLDYYFTTNVTAGDQTQGQAHQEALLQMYVNGLWDYDKYEVFEWGSLWGNPNLAMLPPSLSVSLPNAAPDVLAPGESTNFDVQIDPGDESLVPGTALLHWRYAGGTYVTTALAPVSGNLYQATLPAARCGDAPEFYVSAEGSESGVVTDPFNAPAEVYTALVGEYTLLSEHDFESGDQGWTVGDVDDDATTGIWGRMDPEYTEAQPEDDHTPAPGTMCFVTDGRAGTSLGDYDVDGGKTTLFSPMFDLSGLTNARISYWRWYSNDTGGAPNADVFVVDISDDDGATWENAETVGPSGAGCSGGWIYHEFQVTDFVTPTSQIKLRFIASDEGSGSLVEAAVDDFQIETFGCQGPDSDGDSVPDATDNCPADYNPLQEDADGDDVGDACDGCPNDPAKTDPGICGCGVADTDLDGDLTPDCNDGCPTDPDKVDPGICGCGVPDTDSDGDSTPDCSDACPNEPALTEPEGPQELNCIDGIDNDCDALTDADDTDCAPPACTCGDIDNSGGAVDLGDFSMFANCYGLTAPSPPTCEAEQFACSDLDTDGEVTLNDFSTFAIMFGTASTDAPPNCLP